MTSSTSTTNITKVGGNSIAVGSGVLSTGCIRVAVPTDNIVKTDLQSLDGYDISVGGGVKDAGTQRVTIATDDSVAGYLQLISESVSGGESSQNLVSLNGITIAVNSGVNSDGTQRVTLATNDAATTGIAIIADAVNDSKMDINLAHVNSNDISVNSGVKDTGTLRVCIASDDVVSTKLSTMGSAVSQQNYLVNIENLLGTNIAVNSGVKGNGVQRVAIATDDINMATINTSTATSATGITTLAGSVSSSKINQNLISLNGTTVSVNSGIKNDGTQRITIAEDDVVTTGIGIIAYAVNDGKMDVNISRINGYTTAVNTGSKDPGTQRVTLATDDYNTTQARLSLATIAGTVTGSKIDQNLASVNGTTIDVLAGSTGAGTQRVCLATNDINTSAISVSTTTSATKLTTLADTVTSGKINQNLVSLDNNTVSVNSGVNGTGVQRVTIATDDVNMAILSAGVTSSKYNCNIKQLSNNALLQNYVSNIVSNMKSSYEYDFTNVSYSTNTLIKTFWELTIGTNMTITSSIGQGISFNSSENTTTNRQIIMETRHKYPLITNSMLIYNFGLNSSTAYNVTNQCTFYMGLLGYQASSIIGLICNQPQKFSIMDGNSTTDQSSWNIDILNGSGLSAKTLTFGTNNYSFFMLFCGSNVNENVIFGFIVDGQFCPVHQILSQNQTVANTRKTLGTLIYYANSYTGNVGAFATIRNISVLNSIGSSISSTLRRNIRSFTPSSISTPIGTMAAAVGARTIFAITLNDTFSNIGLAITPDKFLAATTFGITSVIALSCYYVNNDTYTFTGGNPTGTVNLTYNGLPVTITYGFDGTETLSGLFLMMGESKQGNSVVMDFGQCINAFMFLGQTATNNTKTKLVFQLGFHTAVTGTVYGGLTVDSF